MIVLFLVFGQIFSFTPEVVKKQIDKVPYPGKKHEDTVESSKFPLEYKPHDKHPISLLIAEADKRWRAYDESRSTTFKQVVDKYRQNHGRHPPPGFDVWYKFARDRNVHNIDDFQQIMDDMRPFWAVQPRRLRRLAAHMWEDKKDGISGLHVRGGKVAKTTNGGWRCLIWISP
jgi:hypothetical protein